MQTQIAGVAVVRGRSQGRLDRRQPIRSELGEGLARLGDVRARWISMCCRTLVGIG